MSIELQVKKHEQKNDGEEEFNAELYYLRSEENIFENVDIETSKKKIRNLLRKQLQNENLNIFIGSGCSLPAIPLMGDTFSLLKKQEELELGVYEGDSKNIEGYLDWLNTGIRFLEQQSTGKEEESTQEKILKKSFNITKKYLLESIVKDYNVKLEDTEDETMEKIIKTKANYRHFYNAIFSIRDLKDYSPVNIFTTNYDLFNEVAMEELDIQYTNGFKGTVKRTFDPTVFQLRLVDDENRYKDKWSIFRRYVKLHKIHGSIDWSYDSESGLVIQSAYTKASNKDILIYPTINKHLETQQTL